MICGYTVLNVKVHCYCSFSPEALGLQRLHPNPTSPPVACIDRESSISDLCFCSSGKYHLATM